MKIEIAEHERMSESGSSLLRLIQNQDIPLLDLLVRESIQNSLDAAIKKERCVEVDLRVGEFESRKLNEHLERIGDALNRKFSRHKCKYISIRDSKTTGLTGPIRYSEVRANEFGNLLKLVYEICKPQQDEGAGGSWGLGKTIYFRLGIGLVVYYSRIFQNGRYQSRLAACLVEDETKKDALIPITSGVKRGIAWWGRRDGRTSTVPVENESDIRRILSVFGIKPYGADETGTTIIIPYIDEKALLDEVYATNESPEQKPYWASSVSEYLKVAVQRWYAPRLLNTTYSFGPYLTAKVNGEKLIVSSMLSTFKAIRELYILATGGTLDDDSLIKSGNVDVQLESVDLRGVLNTTSSGKIAYAKFSRAQLRMEPPSNEKTPYQQITNISIQMDGGNSPIIMYTRRPGMIVGYDYDGQWTHRMPHSGEGEYIIGLFVANSQNTLKSITDSRTGSPLSLEEYIRQGEKADHASWTDRNIGGNNPRIVSSIQKNIINKVKKKYAEAITEPPERQNVGLGHALANLLLPSDDFGNSPTPPTPNPPPPGPTRPRQGKKSAIHMVGQPAYKTDRVTVSFEIFLTGKPCILALQVLTDFKRYEADFWESENEIGLGFPLEFDSCSITSVQVLPKGKNNPPQSKDIRADRNTPSVTDQYISVSINQSVRFNKASYIVLTPHLEKCQVTGTLSFRFDDPDIKGGLDLKECVS